MAREALGCPRREERGGAILCRHAHSLFYLHPEKPPWYLMFFPLLNFSVYELFVVDVRTGWTSVRYSAGPGADTLISRPAPPPPAQGTCCGNLHELLVYSFNLFFFWFANKPIMPRLTTDMHKYNKNLHYICFQYSVAYCTFRICKLLSFLRANKITCYNAIQINSSHQMTF